MTQADADRMRVSDAEREAVATRLNLAVGEGRLTLEEFSDRVSVAYAARTRGDLAGLLDDLPGPAPVAASQLVPVPPPSSTAPARPARLPLIGPIKRSGRWRLDADTELGATIGAMKLDLRGAEIAAPEVTLSVRTVLGSIKVWVPKEVRVVVEGTSAVGTRGIEENHLPPHIPAPTLRLRLDTIVGSVKVYRV